MKAAPLSKKKEKSLCLLIVLPFVVAVVHCNKIYSLKIMQKVKILLPNELLSMFKLLCDGKTYYNIFL